ncbi:hypothetical protein Lesp02_08320 [Lentzea sp. NBRC 105346]|nr:hypothetical protein Lesp02_08320 [Lentzea sp. NBRC 105346]
MDRATNSRAILVFPTPPGPTSDVSLLFRIVDRNREISCSRPTNVFVTARPEFANNADPHHTSDHQITHHYTERGDMATLSDFPT